MRLKLLLLAAGVATTAFTSAEAGAAIYLGPFTGTLTIDSTLPVTPNFYTEYAGQAGTLTIEMGGYTFSTPLEEVIVPVALPSFQYSWAAVGVSDTINGTPAPLGSYMILYLYGSTTSIGSILPESWSAYSRGEFNGLIAGGGDFGGALTSLTQVNSSALFDLRGNGDFNIPSLKGLTPLPATLPLFATGVGVLGLFGWRRKRKNAALAAA